MGANSGKYHLVAQIGDVYPYRVSVGTCRGPSGITQLVLVRQPLPNALGSAEERSRLLASARQLVRASHPCLAAVYDVEDDPSDVSFVGEYLEGQTLGRIIDTARSVRNAFPHRVLLRVVADVLRGLEYLHGLRGSAGEPLGIVHGSIHPDSIVVTYDGAVKIVGLESVGVRLDWRREAPPDSLGSSYAAPEQLSGGAFDARADLFAVGLLVWEIIARQPLFRGGRQGIEHRLSEGPLPSISTLVRGVPELLQAVLERSLRVNPAERYANAGEMLRDIESYLATAARNGAPENIGERMMAVFGNDAEHAQRWTASWLRGASSGVGVDGGGQGVGVAGPGGWLGAAAVWPPSLPRGATSSSLVVIPPLEEIDERPARRRRPLATGVVLGVALTLVLAGTVAAVGFLWRWSTSSVASAPAQTAAAPMTAAPAAPEATVPAPLAPAATLEGPSGGSVQQSPVVKAATVRLDSEPSHASVEWQGQVVGRTPIQLTVPLGLQHFEISQTGYQPQDVVIDTSVTVGPEGFSTKVLLLPERQQRTVTATARRGGDSSRSDTSGDRGAKMSGAAAPAKATTTTSDAPASAQRDPSAGASGEGRTPPGRTPTIRVINAESPTIRTIDDTSDGPKVKVIDDD